MAYDGLTVEYMVRATGDPFFIPGNCQAPTSSHDNPDNGTKAEQLAQCVKLSPDGVAVQVTGSIAIVNTVSEGTGYTEGSYNNVPVTGGSGSGATLDAQYLSGSWVYIIFQAGGTGYKVGDLLSVDAANVGGTGSGLSMEVTQVF